MEKDVLGSILKQHREKTYPGEGLRRVAKKVGIDYAHLFRLESGQYVPSDDSLIKLLTAYGVPPEEKLKIFTIARLTSNVFDEAIKHVDNEERVTKVVMDALYRRNNNSHFKPKDENEPKKQ